MNLAELLAQADAATQNVELKNDEGFQLIDPGRYTVAVTGAEGPIESNRTNPSNPNEHGQYLVIELTITGPKFENRKLWMNNNIICVPKDTSADALKKCQTAMAIGAKERKVMLDALGRSGLNAANELVGATFDVMVKTEAGRDGYKDKSVVYKVLPSGAATPSVQSRRQAPDATPSATSKPKMPWEK